MKRIALAVAAFVAMLALLPAAAMAATSATVTTGAATAVTPTTATVAGSVNLEGNSYATGNTCEVEYGTSTSYGSTVACPTALTSGSSTATAESFNLTGLTAGTTYHYNVTITYGGLLLGIGASTATGTDATFTTPTTTVPPTAATAAATDVGGSGATLEGSVNPENYGLTSCTFTYTPSGGTAQTAKCATTPTGSTAQTVSAAVTGLAEGTAYTYTLAIGYSGGSSAATVTSTSSGSFTTMSAAVAAPAALESTSATLNGSVDPEGQTVTDCEFYYGTSVNTLTASPCSVADSAITGTTPTTVTAAVAGLTASTTYIDTIVLTTAGGTAVAPVQSFTTPATALAPLASTGAATSVTSTTAVLHANVNAEGQGIRACEFLFGVNDLTTSQGQDEALTELCNTTPTDAGTQSVTVTLKGLAPGTKYYYRLFFLTYGGYAESTQMTFETKATAAKPGVKISAATINRQAKTAKFKFARSGATAATKFQCGLATVTKGKVSKFTYSSCKSAKTYTKLKAKTYEFYVRAGDAAGFGAAKSRKFTL